MNHKRIIEIALVLLLAAAAHGQGPLPAGNQFQINTYTTAGQSNSAVVSDSSGNFLVVWESSGSSGTDSHITSIQGQRFNSDGSPLGGELQVNTFTLLKQRFAAASAGPGGSFVVVWQSESTNTGDDSGYSIKGQRYDSASMRVGAEFQINTYTTDNQFFPFISSNSSGDFVVVWESNGSNGDTTAYSIQGQRYASDGSKTGSQFQVNTDTLGSERFFLAELPLSMDDAGNFVVVWTSSNYGAGGGDGSGSSVRGRRFDSSGMALGPDFQINTYTTDAQRLPSASMTQDGGFLAVWESDGSNGTDTDARSIQARRFASDGTAIGNDFQVNTYTAAKQILPMAGTDSSGRLIVTWQSGDHSGNGADGDLGGIRGQFFDSGGTALGGEFQVNSDTAGNQRYPSVAMGSGRDFFVVWDGPEGGSNGIQGRRFVSPDTGPAHEPIPIGGEFQINTYTGGSQNHPEVDYDSSGNFTVAWTDENGNAGSDNFWSSVQARRFDSDGLPLDVEEFQINTDFVYHQKYPDIAIAPGGESVVTWHSGQNFYPNGGTGWEVKAQRYDSSASPSGAEFRVNTYTTNNQFYPSVSSDAGGNFVVVWESRGSSGTDSGYSIQGQRYNSGGGSISSEFQINTITLGVQRFGGNGSPLSMNEDGSFVVVWTSHEYGDGDGGDGSDSAARGRGYASDGTPFGPDFLVNSYTTGGQNHPSVSIGSGGDFVVAWESEGSTGTDTDGLSIQAQRFASDGIAIGNQVQVNTYTTGNQNLPTIATDDSGRFIVVWRSGDSVTAGPDGDQSSIQARFFDSDGTPVSSEFQVNTYTTLDQNWPTVAMGPDHEFVVVWAGRGDGSAASIWGQRYTTVLPPPVFSKSFAPNPIAFDEQTTLTFTIDNMTNPVAVDNLAFTDNLPPGMTIANPSGASNGCGGLLNADPGTGVITLTGGSVAAESTCTLQVDIDAISGGMHVNTTGDLTSDAGNSGPASATLTVNCEVDLVLTKSESADPVTAGSGPLNLTYTITVGNNGPCPTTGLTLSETLTLPPGVTIDLITPSLGTSYAPPNANGIWTVGTLSVSDVATLVVMLTVDESIEADADVVCDTVTVAGVNEPNVGDSSVTECTSVVNPFLIFQDGFESDDTLAWSGTVGG